MLTPLSPSLLVVLILSWARPGDLFTLSPLRQPARAKLSRRERLPVSSSRRSSSSTTTDVDNSKPKSAATIALENLLAQQKADVRGTERLLAILESVEDGDDREDFEAEVDSETKSTAASLLSGFDYGFKSRSEGEATKLTPGLIIDGLGYGGPPPNLWTLGTRQFIRNWEAIKGEYRDEEEVALTEKQDKLQAKLEQLTLNSTEIWEREFSDGPIDAPLVIKVPYLLVCYLLDVVFEDRYVPSRFFLLETVARMPYFSYITCLHLYETLGFWRRSSEMKRIHFAEELNEFNHLLIMESLGGDQPWWVRFVAQHSAIVYYVVLCLLWAVSPSLSYRFSELLETHAVNTYGVFLDDNEELLKELPPSLAAIEYYTFGITDSFYGEFQTSALSSGDGVSVSYCYDSRVSVSEGCLTLHSFSRYYSYYTILICADLFCTALHCITSHYITDS